MQVTVLTPVGAEVTGLDLRQATDDGVEILRNLLGDHGVVVLRDQGLDDDGFVRFLRRLGRLTFTTGERPVESHPDLNVISNVGRSVPPRSSFHTDTSYVSEPPAYTALRVVTLPVRGGETLFTNQYRAYDTLPADARAAIAGRVVHHVVTGIAPGVLTTSDEQAADHPLELRHPRSGRTALFLTTPKRCAGVAGMADAEADQLIERLYAHSTVDDNVYRHSWRDGDVVVWDNRCVMHRADHGDVVGDRVLHRGVVVEE